MVVGAVEIEPVLDAVGLLAEYGEAYPGVAAEEWEPYRELYPELFAGAEWRFPVKAYVVRSRDATILVDTGVGPAGLANFWRPEREGLLPAGLAAAGVRPDEVDLVLLTHLHIDHLGWNADAHGVPFFPSARYLVHRAAFAFAHERRDRPHLARCVAALADRFELLEDDAELAPGISAFLTPGHYPGHMSVRIASEGSEAVIVGDVAPHPALLDRPEWAFAFDEDSAENELTRRELLAALTDSDTLFVCTHYPGSGIGRALSRDGRVVWETA